MGGKGGKNGRFAEEKRDAHRCHEKERRSARRNGEKPHKWRQPRPAAPPRSDRRHPLEGRRQNGGASSAPQRFSRSCALFRLLAVLQPISGRDLSGSTNQRADRAGG